MERGDEAPGQSVAGAGGLADSLAVSAYLPLSLGLVAFPLVLALFAAASGEVVADGNRRRSPNRTRSQNRNTSSSTFWSSIVNARGFDVLCAHRAEWLAR